MSRYFVKGAFAGSKGRLQGRGGVWHCFWGVRRGKRRSLGGRGVCKGARAWGNVFGAFARARNACMIVFAADVRFFVNLNFMYIFIIIFEG